MTLYSNSEKARDTEYGTAAHFVYGCLGGLSDNTHTAQSTTWSFNEIRGRTALLVFIPLNP